MWPLRTKATLSRYFSLKTAEITRQAVCLQRDTDARSCKHCCSGKAISITYSECVPSVKCARATLSPVAFPPLQYIFPHYLITEYDFRKKLLNIKSIFWFSLQILSETFLILRRIERDMFKNVYWSSCKAYVILVRF